MASKDTFQGAAASLFLAGSVLAGLYFFQPEMIEINSEDNEEDQGHVFLSEEEYAKQDEQFNELQTENDLLQEQVKQLEESLDEEEKESSHPPKTNVPLFYSILSIEQGMTSQDISSKLLMLNIIESRDSFEQELLDKEVENRIQIGQYTLDNQMSIEEIVQLITAY